MIVKGTVISTQSVFATKDMSRATPPVVEFPWSSMMRNVLSKGCCDLFERVPLFPIGRPILFQHILETIVPIVV
jgi:hypothetical protein